MSMHCLFSRSRIHLFDLHTTMKFTIPTPFFRAVAALLLLASLTACSAPKLNEQQAASIKTVGVISLMPQELKYRKIGITVFGNSSKVLPVEGDVLNAHARSVAQNYLNKTGRYAVKQIQISDVNGMASRLNARTMVMTHSIERIDAEVVELAKANHVDAVVLIAENFDGENRIYGVSVTQFPSLGEANPGAARAGLQVAGLTVGNEIFMSSYANPGPGTVVARPGGKPWTDKLEDNLDEGTHQNAIKAMLPEMTRMIESAMKNAGL